MLKVTIPAASVAELGHVGYAAYVIDALRKEGIPLSPVMGVLKAGTLSVFKDPKTLDTIYIWKD